eukprot:5815197-Alexandrium_andersonii.AAC.1
MRAERRQTLSQTTDALTIQVKAVTGAVSQPVRSAWASQADCAQDARLLEDGPSQACATATWTH